MNKQFAKPFVIGAVIAIAVVGGAILAQPLISLHQNRISYQNQNGNFLLNVGSGGSFCPYSYAVPTTMQGYGFLMGKEGQLVIQPNSTAFLKINYENPNQEVTPSSIYNASEPFALALPPNQGWFRVVGNNVNPGVNYDDTEIGLAAYVNNVTILPSHLNMSITYELVTSPNATEGTYTSVFWSICAPYLLVDVGSSYYNGTYGTGVFF